MSKITRIIFAGLSLSIITLVFALFNSGPTPAQVPAPPVAVRVTNIPLPVQGVVNANVTNTVPVSGTVNANLTNPRLLPQLASDTVTLQATSYFSASCAGAPAIFAFDRSVVKSGGTVGPFTLPAGMVFVATSLDWSATGTTANGNPSPAANRARTAFLVRVNGGYNGASAQSTAIADSNGRAGGSETFPTGIVLQNPGEFCLGMDTPVTGEVLTGVLQGFLAPDR